MTPEDAGQLLGHAAMFDNRKPSAGAAIAWAAALHDVPLDQDTFGAVARYYGLAASDDPNDKRWIQPHHVRFHRARIRAPRIADAHPVYSGQPLETGAESGVSIRDLERAAGDGRLGVRTVQQAIEARDQRRPLDSRVRAMIEAVAHDAPDEDQGAGPEQPPVGCNVLAVACPICAAAIGRACRTGRGQRRADVHPARKEDAQRAVAGRPPADRDQARRDEERRIEAARQLMEAEGGPSKFVPPTRAEVEAAERKAKASTGADQ